MPPSAQGKSFLSLSFSMNRRMIKMTTLIQRALRTARPVARLNLATLLSTEPVLKYIVQAILAVYAVLDDQVKSPVG